MKSLRGRSQDYPRRCRSWNTKRKCSLKQVRHEKCGQMQKDKRPMSREGNKFELKARNINI